MVFYARLLNTSIFNEISLKLSITSNNIRFEVGMNLLIAITR
jgi:hypothetical protein